MRRPQNVKKISLLFWRLLSKSADLSKQEGDFFKFLWPFQKSWTLASQFGLRKKRTADFYRFSDWDHFNLITFQEKACRSWIKNLIGEACAEWGWIRKETQIFHIFWKAKKKTWKNCKTISVLKPRVYCFDSWNLIKQ